MEESAGIYARESSYLDRYVQLGYASGKVLNVAFPADRPGDAEESHDLLDRIDAYLEGEPDSFEDVDVALTLPTDQREVLETVRMLPYGEDAFVEQIARMTASLDAENDDDHRLVREALEANPAPLLVPDHRVRDGPSAAPPQVEQKLRLLEDL